MFGMKFSTPSGQISVWEAWYMNAKDAHKTFRTEKLAVVPEIQPFFVIAIILVMANILTLDRKLPKHIKYVSRVQMP